MHRLSLRGIDAQLRKLLGVRVGNAADGVFVAFFMSGLRIEFQVAEIFFFLDVANNYFTKLFLVFDFMRLEVMADYRGRGLPVLEALITVQLFVTLQQLL